MGFDIALPDFSTLSRRSKGLALPSTKTRATTSGPVHLVVDSTGLKVFGEDEWLENKHKTKAKRKRWRNCTLVSILSVGEIVCSDLTADEDRRSDSVTRTSGPDRWPHREVHCGRRL
ncbi:transposase [Sinorhizobium medicae]|uniref:transposase n=1 Tax=Sinorhizobium medicae TaxID=110321 RepID=UPI001F469B6E|nr:transposase [Sinorhizobium medicae]